MIDLQTASYMAELDLRRSRPVPGMTRTEQRELLREAWLSREIREVPVLACPAYDPADDGCHWWSMSVNDDDAASRLALHLQRNPGHRPQEPAS